MTWAFESAYCTWTSNKAWAVKGPVIRDQVYKYDSYLWDLHWATTPNHRLCRWTRLAHIHSLCRLCRSSSSSLLLSLWPVCNTAIFHMPKEGFSRKSAISDDLFSYCNKKVTLKKNSICWRQLSTWIKIYLITLESKCEFQLISCWIWKLFNNNFFNKENWLHYVLQS